jgi:hypothetical protein
VYRARPAIRRPHRRKRSYFGAPREALVDDLVFSQAPDVTHITALAGSMR